MLCPRCGGVLTQKGDPYYSQGNQYQKYACDGVSRKGVLCRGIAKVLNGFTGGETKHVICKNEFTRVVPESELLDE